MKRRVTVVGLAVLATLAGLRPSDAQTRFFEGKTIRIIVGFSAGGGFDTYSRPSPAISGGTSPVIPR